MSDLDRLQELVANDPEAAMRLLESVRSKVMHPHPGQVPVIEDEARFKVLNAGRRWGKTMVGAKIILREARKPNQMLWWVAPTYRVVKRGYGEVLKQLPPGVLTHEPPPDTNFDAGRSVILKFKNGTRMEFYSAERPEGMLGAGVDFAILDEAAIMPARIWNQIVSPTLMDREGSVLMISTPRGRNWFYKAWLKGQDPDDTLWASWTFTSADNPTLPPAEMERMKADLPRLEYEQEVLASFLAEGSSVFHYPETAVQKAAIKRTGLVEGESFVGHHIVLGIDLAKTTDWTVLYGASAETFRNVYFERLHGVLWREQKRRIRRAVALLRRAGATSVTLVMDSTGVGDPIVEDMETYGYDVVPINFTTHKTNMVRNFAKDLEDGRALILDAFQHEFENYEMAVTARGKATYSAPQGEHDDVVSAKILQHHGLSTEGVPGATVIQASPDLREEGPNEPSPEDELIDPDDYSDLLDAEDEQEALREERVQALHDFMRPPTVAELMAHDPAWTSHPR